MTTHNFTISGIELENLLNNYPNIGKNSDVGKIAVEVAKMFLTSVNHDITFIKRRGIDLTSVIDGIEENFEIKGTASNNISWNQLKVSSQFCHDNLVNGMSILRITNIGNLTMGIHYLKHSEDFILIAEPRWTICKVRK